MIDRNSEFFRMSKEIAADFLQSTVIIDDSPFRSISSSEDPNSGDAHIRSKAASRRQETSHRRLRFHHRSRTRKTSTLEIDHSSNPYFDARVVISAFAKKRIVCSVINPQKTEMDSLPELICDLADCADIVVIDWSLHNDEGEKAMEIIASILRQDETRPPGRLRLLAIYTVNPAIAQDSHHNQGAS